MNNILRKNRKRNNRPRLRRYILLVFSLIMTTFAWFTYSKILNTGLDIHINSWNIVFYLDENKNGVGEEAELKENPIDISLENLYPGMEEQVIDVLIENNGETATDIAYTIPEIKLLGNTYTIEETVPESNPYYIIKNETTVTNGIAKYAFIDEPLRFPFKIEIINTQEILSEGQGYLKVRVSWPLYNPDDTEEERDIKDELDTEWGYNVAKYIEAGNATPISMKLRINAIGKPRSEQQEAAIISNKITSSNYGDYVNYSKDLNGDGNTKNDWRVFYNDGENVFLIAADYLPNTWNENPTMKKGTGEYATYGTAWDTVPSGLTIDPTSKYMISQAGRFTNTYANYQTTASLLTTGYWNNLVDTTYANSAIGSPTIEMWMASWNAIYPNDMLYCNNADSRGYYIGTSDIPTKTQLTSSIMTAKEGYNNTLFYPHKTYNNLDGTDSGDCYGYYFASPIAVNDVEQVANLVYDGRIITDYFNFNEVGLRPVVMLKSNIYGTYKDSTWELSTEAPKEFVDDYGDFVNYPIDLNEDGNTENDWKIFYDNGENIFLISADYLPNKWNENPTMTKSTDNYATYCSYWDTNPSGLTIDVNSKYMISKARSFTSTNQNYQVIASLLKREYWTNLVNTTYAESAIGSPTIEMWTSSWNDIYPDEKIYCNNSSQYGYFVGTTDTPTETELTPSVMKSKEGYNNELFYPHKIQDNLNGTESGDCIGYYLAAPVR